MTYEMIFGDEKLFDGALGECFCVAKDAYGDRIFYKAECGALFWLDNDEWKPLQVTACTPIAMRRIIKAPVWTMEDKLAGRLPPIGSKYLAGSDKREFTCLFHGKGNGTVSVIGFNSDDEVTGYQVQYCYPIESPEEKAARLREEWCIKALSSCSILSGMQKYELKRLSVYIEDIYDALLSGELAAPKGGE